MKSKFISILLMAIILVAVAGMQSLFAQDQVKMKYEDYLIELQSWVDREDAAKVTIAGLEADIASLNTQITALDKQIADATASIYRSIGTDDRGLRDYVNRVNRFRDQVRGLLNLDSGELFKRRDEVGDVETRFAELKNEGAARHPDSQQIIREIERLLSNVMTELKNAGPQFDIYDVAKGDYLYRISGKSEVYGDPLQWLKIWTKNRDQIKNPDLIYPDQKLKIFRDIADNEHLVLRGENLSRIAGLPSVYNDPLQWTKLFEANKDVISDKNVIYPHMILIKP